MLTELQRGSCKRESSVTKTVARKPGLRTSVAYYLDFFRYGYPPHGGFGLGLARLVMLMLGLPSIREATFLHRGPTRLTP